MTLVKWFLINWLIHVHANIETVFSSHSSAYKVCAADQKELRFNIRLIGYKGRESKLTILRSKLLFKWLDCVTHQLSSSPVQKLALKPEKQQFLWFNCILCRKCFIFREYIPVFPAESTNFDEKKNQCMPNLEHSLKKKRPFLSTIWKEFLTHQ